MNRRTLTILIVSAVILAAGIVVAISSLYSDKGRSEGETLNGHFIENHSLLKAVPSDAAIVFCVKDFRRACEYMADSSAVFGKLASDKFKGIASGIYPEIKKNRAIISVHYSKDMPPLLIVETGMPEQADTTMAADTTADVRRLLAAADASGLFSRLSHGLALISSSETIISSSVRHLDEGHSILESNGFTDLASKMKGDDAIFVNNAYTENIVDEFLSGKHRSKSDFFKDLTSWTAFTITRHSNAGVEMHGEMLYGSDPSFYLNLIENGESSTVAEAVPSNTDFVASLPTGNISKYIKAYRNYLDAKIRLDKYEATLDEEKAANGKNAEEWAKEIDLQEIAIADIFFDKDMHQLLLIRKGSKKQDVSGAAAFPYAGYAKVLFGNMFTGESEDSYCSIGNWLIIGAEACVKEYAKLMAEGGSLKDCLSDNSLEDRIPQKGCGFWMYHSLAEDPSLLEINFSKSMAEGMREMIKGASYIPVTLSVTAGSGKALMDLAVERTAISKSKAPAEDRDTTVTVPEGPFKVMNSGTGKENTFYQNSHLSLCLQDENGKDQWGVPFKEKICGYVQGIDFFDNGKIQFLFAAGSKLYLMDRLGRFVSGFPVDLGKGIALGPGIYDATGSKAYRAIVLFKDNTIGNFDLHGNPTQGWNGIKSSETIKSLPEILEVEGKKYWTVRTSRQAMIYPFNGGEPLVKGEGDKMIRPESGITAGEKGTITAKCYDGKERSFKLTK